jgi:hypothetical protein
VRPPIGASEGVAASPSSDLPAAAAEAKGDDAARGNLEAIIAAPQVEGLDSERMLQAGAIIPRRHEIAVGPDCSPAERVRRSRLQRWQSPPGPTRP